MMPMKRTPHPPPRCGGTLFRNAGEGKQKGSPPSAYAKGFGGQVAGMTREKRRGDGDSVIS
jgi:hypothetical protein